jgi:pheromone shutdown-related protein TraB
VSDNVTVLKKDGKTYHIIGTAHISKESVDEVNRVIDEIKPDTVCVELCETRYQSMTDSDRWKKLDIFQIIREKKVLFLMSSIAMGAFQRRLGAELGVKPGAEFKAAIEKANEIGAKVVLADRNIQATLKRTWRRLSFFKKLNTFNMLVESLFSKETISEEEIEKMKEKDQLTEVMNEFAQENPEIQKPLIDERDQYLMSSIEEAEGETIVAVVGAGHVPGMQTYFGKKIDKDALNVIPPVKKFVPLLKWVIPVLLVWAFYNGYTKSQENTFEQMLNAWIYPNILFAMLFTIAARAKFITVIAAGILSPITSLIPLIGTGMFTAWIEAHLNRPTVEDAERIPDEVVDFKGMYKNKFTHILLVFVMSNAGSSIGAYIGIGWVLTLFSGL